jgi:hypothetical protein
LLGCKCTWWRRVSTRRSRRRGPGIHRNPDDCRVSPSYAPAAATTALGASPASGAPRVVTSAVNQRNLRAPGRTSPLTTSWSTWPPTPITDSNSRTATRSGPDHVPWDAIRNCRAAGVGPRHRCVGERSCPPIALALLIGYGMLARTCKDLGDRFTLAAARVRPCRRGCFARCHTPWPTPTAP